MTIFDGELVDETELSQKQTKKNREDQLRHYVDTESKKKRQSPLILRFNRLMDVFAKSDDERDFFLDKLEGLIFYRDLDKSESELNELDRAIQSESNRYSLVPKLTFYEQKKLMEGFAHEKVYDIDTKEKMLDIVSSKDPRENFLEFLLDHPSEHDKWQQYYQDKSRIRIIEWLRFLSLEFAFEEDIDIPKHIIEKVKREFFSTKVSKDIAEARKALFIKSHTYYSNDALNPRPKRGRPPKQVVKQEIEKLASEDIYSTVPSSICSFLYIPEITAASDVTFSSKFNSQHELVANFRNLNKVSPIAQLEELSKRLSLAKISESEDEIVLNINEKDRKDSTNKSGRTKSSKK